MSKERSKTDFGPFLQDRRGHVSPAEVGLPSGSRRRVAGLRREEIATLAGVGLTWYTMLENGTADRVSPATLDAIGRALRMTGDELAYLHMLASRERPHAAGAAGSVDARRARCNRRRSHLQACVCRLHRRRDLRASVVGSFDRPSRATDPQSIESPNVGTFAYEAITLVAPGDAGRSIVIQVPSDAAARRLRTALDAMPIQERPRERLDVPG